MRAIIIAAGRGSRLEHHTDACPKCMVEINGRSILSFQLEAFEANGVDDLHVVRGYLSDKLTVSGATYYENEVWEQNNILHSLFCAEDAFAGPLLTTYSDIVYTPQVVEKLLATTHDIALVVDADWAKTYVGRDDHPVEQAELCEADGEFVTQVGKWVGPEATIGEFIGLAYYSDEGARQLLEIWRDLRANLGDDEPFRHAELFRKAYHADLFNKTIARGVKVGFVQIEGGWREIDTVQDLERLSAQGSV